MQYVISFLEGVITFISPCLLPMLPVYVSYFAGGGERTTRKTLLGAVGFVTGFTAVFVMMGALAGSVGSLLKQYQAAVNIFGKSYEYTAKYRAFALPPPLEERQKGFRSLPLWRQRRYTDCLK